MMGTILWYIGGVLGALILALLLLVWLRKLQYDAIHQNFLDLVDELGGEVIRGGFAVRPRYRGQYRGRWVSISISSEKKEQGREYYISVLMQCRAPVNFTLLSRRWIGSGRMENAERRHLREVAEGAFVLEVSQEAHFQKLNSAALEEAVRSLQPFAYLLAARSRMILERVSTRLIDDTKKDVLLNLLDQMERLCQFLEHSNGK